MIRTPPRPTRTDVLFPAPAHFRSAPAKASQVFPDGIGQIARPSDTKGPISPRVERRRDIDASVDYVIAAQKWAMEETRLGIPILFHEESLDRKSTRLNSSH